MTDEDLKVALGILLAVVLFIGFIYSLLKSAETPKHLSE